MTTYTVAISFRGSPSIGPLRSFETLDAAKAHTWRAKRQFPNNDYMIFADYLSPKSRYVWGTITATAEERDAA